MRTVDARTPKVSAASSSTSLSGGFSDANTGATPPTTGSTGVVVSGSYTVSSTESATLNLTLSDAAGSSTFNMYLVDPTLNILDPNNTTGGGGALLLHTDGNINGTGILVRQQTTTIPAQTFLGSYALNLNNSIAATPPNELDLVGVLKANNPQVLGGGTADLADYEEVSTVPPVTMLGAPLSGTFAPDSSHPGRSIGNLTVGVNVPKPPAIGAYPFIAEITSPPTPVTFSVAFYQISNGQAFIVQTDIQANVSGYLIQQQLP